MQYLEFSKRTTWPGMGVSNTWLVRIGAVQSEENLQGLASNTQHRQLSITRKIVITQSALVQVTGRSGPVLRGTCVEDLECSA